MQILQNGQFILNAPQAQVRTTETVAAESNVATGEIGLGKTSVNTPESAQEGFVDPPDLVGPPPAFPMNVLEAERVRLREGETIEAEQSTPNKATSDITQARETRARELEAPEPTRSAYGGMREDPPRMLDVSR